MDSKARTQRRTIILVMLFIAVTAITTIQSLTSPLAAWVMLVHIFIIIVSFFQPFYGLVVYIAFIYIIPHGIWPELAKLRIMLRFASILLVMFLIHKTFRKENIHILSNRQQILMILLLFIVPISNISNFRLKASWEATNKFLTVFLLFFFIVNLTDNFKKFRKVCWTLVVCTTCMAINGIIQHQRGYDLIGTPLTLDGRIQWLVWFGDPNDLALAFNTFIPILLMFFLEKDASILKKTILALTIGILLLGLYYTNSRGGIIAFLTMISYLAYRRWGILKGSIVIAACAAAGFVLGPSRMGNISPYEASAAGRINAWIAGVDMFKSRPIFGVGYENFQIFHRRVSHSTFVQVFAELGFVGYFFWLALIYTSFSGLRKVEELSKDTRIKNYSFAVQLTLVGFLGSAFFLTQAFSPVFFITLALAAIILNNADIYLKWPRFLSKREITRIAVLAIASILLYVVIAAVY